MIHLVVSMTADHVIGRDGDQPWYIKEDLEHFKQLTQGHTIIVGRRTLETPALSRPLPNRHTIIVSDTPVTIPNATVCSSIPEALKVAQAFGTEIFVIGGRSIYEQLLPLANVLHISWVKRAYAGNVYFPTYNEHEWQLEESKDFAEFTYKKYQRKISS
ncbi:MAG: dihydrofolate reductase [Candidatus Andersenbacteria bacterium]